MPPRKRRFYAAEYNVEAAHRVIGSGRTITEVARELGIDAGMSSVWVKDERRRIAAAEAHGENPWRRPSGPSCSGGAGSSPSWKRTTPPW